MQTIIIIITGYSIGGFTNLFVALDPVLEVLLLEQLPQWQDFLDHHLDLDCPQRVRGAAYALPLPTHALYIKAKVLRCTFVICDYLLFTHLQRNILTGNRGKRFNEKATARFAFVYFLIFKLCIITLQPQTQNTTQFKVQDVFVLTSKHLTLTHACSSLIHYRCNSFCNFTYTQTLFKRFILLNLGYFIFIIYIFPHLFVIYFCG